MQSKEEFLSGILEATPQGIMVLESVRDAQGCIFDFRIVFTNTSARTLLHLSEEEANNALYTTIAPTSKEYGGFFNNYVKTAEEGIPFTREYKSTRAGQWLLINCEKLKDGLCITLKNINNRKEAERLLSSVMDSSMSGIVAFESIRNDHGEIVDFRWLLINARAEDMLGYSAAKVVGRSQKKINPAAWELGVIKHYINVVETGVPVRVEYPFPIRGQMKWYSVSIVNRDDGYVATFDDITERKKTEEALRKNQEFLLESQSIAQVGSFEWNVQNDNLFWTPELYRMWGYEPGMELQISTFERGLHPEDKDRVMSHLREAINGTIPFDIEYRVVGTDGAMRWVQAKGQVEFDGNNQARQMIGTAMDITVQKLREAELLNINAELLRANRELEQFAYVASHDLKEPLRMVSSYANLLQKKYAGKLDADGEEIISYITEGATRMSTLVSDLLQFSRIGQADFKFVQVDLNEVLVQVKRSLEIRIENAGAQILAKTLPVIHAVPAYMQLLFQNLIENSLKFHSDASPVINIDSEDTVDCWKFSFSDNGIGIEPKYFERIFIIFQRLHTRDKFEGTGIGLSLCKKIIELHGGNIWVESEPGKGSTFSFTVRK